MSGWLITLAMVLCGAILGVISVRLEWSLRQSMVVMLMVAAVISGLLFWGKS